MALDLRDTPIKTPDTNRTGAGEAAADFITPLRRAQAAVDAAIAARVSYLETHPPDITITINGGVEG